MNKQLIITYFEEFKHWLNGGKLLQKQINLVIPAEWEEFVEDWDWPIDELAVIINDSYSHFRKALAEGKTIQVDINYWAFPETDIKNYQDLPKDFTNWSKYKVDCYRIKPEEPQFKVGDWVRIVNCNLVKNQKEVFCIDFIDDKNNCFGFNSDTEYCNMNYLELWKPKPNEWIILESNINDYAFIAVKYNSVALMSERCQPFIGELPTRLKD